MPVAKGHVLTVFGQMSRSQRERRWQTPEEFAVVAKLEEGHVLLVESGQADRVQHRQLLQFVKALQFPKRTRGKAFELLGRFSRKQKISHTRRVSDRFCFQGRRAG